MFMCILAFARHSARVYVIATKSGTISFWQVSSYVYTKIHPNEYSDVAVKA